MLRDGIDPAELRAWAKDDPLPHAFALYDLEHFPQKIRFVSVRAQGKLAAYLLIWYGDPSVPVVHWVGESFPELLARGLPVPPFVALVPPRAVDAARGASGTARTYGIRVLHRAPEGAEGGPPRMAPAGVEVRRLATQDQGRVAALARAQPEMQFLRQLAESDLSKVRVFGAFSDETAPRLLACARTLAELPDLWMIGGVYTAPDERGKGLARAVVGALVQAARGKRVGCGLYVREDNPAALRVYLSLGFREAFPCIWIDGGGGPPP